MTSTALLYDCFSGICGDMHIGAMVDLGVPVEWLSAELGKLELAGEFTLRVAQADKMGITGTQATVDVDPSVAKPARRLTDIKQIISTADYPPEVERLAIRIFEEIGVAEAKIHGTTVEQIHFHEVGATDSIVDIVAAAICLNYLNVETILCGTVEVGGGMVKCAHGILPVPAPATAEILLGVPLHYGRVDSEATTPTGAAILKSVVDEFAIPDGFVANKIGYGIGRKDFEIPNVLRVVLGEVPAAASDRIEKETNVLIECNIDDMSPEA
ncbi:MAG: nickel pincer cofactor biosynthesis protein LarC, partial [Gammaproteobacteria bacterium]|nr:nickel pincer cofactor biosynthesis protein LarC [Gammaproteobacteria bacterium]